MEPEDLELRWREELDPLEGLPGAREELEPLETDPPLYPTAVETDPPLLSGSSQRLETGTKGKVPVLWLEQPLERWLEQPLELETLNSWDIVFRPVA